MANYKLLKRLERSIYLIKNKPGIAKSEILQRLRSDYDQNVSDRTLERDFEVLKTDFGLEIYYDRSQRGYVLQDDPERIATFFKFAELSSLAELYETGLKDYKTFQKWVIPDDSTAFNGLYNIKEVLKGITQGRKMRFTKINYFHDDAKMYTVTPVRLKEYLNRWYLIAVPDGLQEIRTFGLDRLEQLEILDEKGVQLKDIDQQLKKFTDIIGLNYNETAEVQKIVLRVVNSEIKYLRSLKLHHSQVCVEHPDATDWGTVTYHLKPNFEFETQILKLGAMAKVMEPKWFREKIVAQINKMNELYQ